MAKRKYRVREGFTYGAFSQYGAGAIVELEESDAKLNMDKLELAEIVEPTTPVPPPAPPSSSSTGSETSTEDETVIKPKRRLQKSEEKG